MRAHLFNSISFFLLSQRAAAARRTASARIPRRAEIILRRSRAGRIWRGRWWYGSIRTVDRFRRTRSTHCRRTRTRTSSDIPVCRPSKRSKLRAAASSTGKARMSRRWPRGGCPSPATRTIGDRKWCVFAAIRFPTKGRCSEARWTNAEYVTIEKVCLVFSTWCEISSRGVARPRLHCLVIMRFNRKINRRRDPAERRMAAVVLAAVSDGTWKTRGESWRYKRYHSHCRGRGRRRNNKSAVITNSLRILIYLISLLR